MQQQIAFNSDIAVENESSRTNFFCW